MPKVPKLGESGKRKERNAKRDEAFRAVLAAGAAVLGGYNVLAKKADIPYRTLMKRAELPSTARMDEVRRINEALPDGWKLTAEVIGA